jgi:hypothetical protein
MYNAASGEKIGIRKIKLVKPETGTTAVVRSFEDADDYLMEWRCSFGGWLGCEFEIEYLDEHILRGEYKAFRRRDYRVSLSHHIRSTFWKMFKRPDVLPSTNSISDDIEMQLWIGDHISQINGDFLDRYETGNYSRI